MVDQLTYIECMVKRCQHLTARQVLLIHVTKVAGLFEAYVLHTLIKNITLHSLNAEPWFGHASQQRTLIQSGMACNEFKGGGIS